MGLQELIDQHVNEAEQQDAEGLAIIIFEQIMSDAELLQEIVIPALRASIRNRLRILALHNEQNSILSNTPSADPTADRLAFLAERFYVPTVGFVTWAEATVVHHQLRIDYLNKKVDGLVETVTRHDTAIREINAAGVKNLGELHAKPRRRRKAS